MIQKVNAVALDICPKTELKNVWASLLILYRSIQSGMSENPKHDVQWQQMKLTIAWNPSSLAPLEALSSSSTNGNLSCLLKNVYHIFQNMSQKKYNHTVE